MSDQPETPGREYLPNKEWIEGCPCCGTDNGRYGGPFEKPDKICEAHDSPSDNHLATEDCEPVPSLGEVFAQWKALKQKIQRLVDAAKDQDERRRSEIGGVK